MFDVKSLISIQLFRQIAANVEYPIGQVYPTLRGYFLQCVIVSTQDKYIYSHEGTSWSTLIRFLSLSGEKMPKKNLELPDEIKQLLSDGQRYILKLWLSLSAHMMLWCRPTSGLGNLFFSGAASGETGAPGSGACRIFFWGTKADFHHFGRKGRAVLENLSTESYGTSEYLGRGQGLLAPPPSVRWCPPRISRNRFPLPTLGKVEDSTPTGSRSSTQLFFVRIVSSTATAVGLKRFRKIGFRGDGLVLYLESPLNAFKPFFFV